jgi:hypothetical protein
MEIEPDKKQKVAPPKPEMDPEKYTQLITKWIAFVRSRASFA